MTGNGLFVDNSRQLAQPRDLSQFFPHREEHNWPFMDNVTSIRIDSVLAQVAIQVEPNTKFVNLRVYGDFEMAEALKISCHSGHLTLSGELPFTDKAPDSRRGFFKKAFRPFWDALSSGTNVVINDDRVIVDGRRVDLDRKILIVLTIPPHMAVRAGDRFYGLLAVGGHRMDDLVLDSYGFAKCYVDKATRLELTTHGMGRIEAGTVNGELIASTRALGNITVDEAEGSLRLNVHDMGRILVAKARGTATVDSRGMGEAIISGGELQKGSFTTRSMGGITCKATILGDTTASVTSNAMGGIVLTRVRGKLTKSVKGMGTITANGQHYTRSLW
jgi:hypothetical protein